ncbi:hypothetical protein [Sphingobacterium luzhongxinii]|uniref:hypothetical protein n=1 Tax=Sphingobacterium luzhongxinii TaxID=2654181 RepID=UPI0013D8F4D6|nr:hypothetical protein [Sphingobacterium sp. xlx-73]
MGQKEKNAISIVLLLISAQLVFSQKYFLLETNTDKYRTKTYELSTMDLYGIDKKVDVFNILLEDLINRSNPEKTLVLFSALPGAGNDNGWNEINLESVKDSIISIGKLWRLSEQSLYQRFDIQYGTKTKYWNDYKIVVQREGRYYVSSNCLLQFYAIQNRSDIFNQPYNTINIEQNINTITSVKQLYHNTYPNRTFPVGMPPDDSNFDRIRDRREFLSRKLVINDQNYYQFWTFTDWGQIKARALGDHHKVYFAYERGIDRFVYNPTDLIVGGSYDFYFYHYKNEFGIKTDVFNRNVIDEKVMIADMLKAD